MTVSDETSVKAAALARSTAQFKRVLRPNNGTVEMHG